MAQLTPLYSSWWQLTLLHYNSDFQEFPWLQDFVRIKCHGSLQQTRWTLLEGHLWMVCLTSHKGSENQTAFKILNRKQNLCPRMYAFRPWASHNMVWNNGIQGGKWDIASAMQMPRIFIAITTLHYGYYLPRHRYHYHDPRYQLK